MAAASSSPSSSGNSKEPMFNFTYHDLDHPASSLSVMNKMRDNIQLCDVSLRVGTTVTKAHKLVLASSSPYFNAMFNVDMAEKSQSEIEICDVDSGALRLLVEFSYTSRVLITGENVRRLLSASSFLQFDSVRDACCTFLIEQLHPTNCLATWRFAETNSFEDLSNQAYLHVLKRFEAVANCEEYLDLSYSEVENLVSDDKLCVLSDEPVYVAVIRWIKHDVIERSQYIAQLFGHVRLTQISKEFLFDVVYKEPLVLNDYSCMDVLTNTTMYHLLPERRSELSSKRTERRVGGLGVFAIGGRCDDTVYNSGERYDFANDHWLPIAPMSRCRANAGIAALGNRIYAIGGHDGNVFLSSSECYDPISNEWSLVKSLDTNSSRFGISAMDGFLYVCGGYDGSSAISNVKRYDPLTDVWWSCPSMITCRWDCRVSVLNNCLYVIGGRLNYTNYLSTVERYDPRMSKWMAAPDMSGPRGGSSVATLDDTLYCVGGFDATETVLSSGERLNVRRNVWEPIADMQCSRAYQGVVTVNERILVLGGYDSLITTETFLNTTEQYDPRNDEWTTATPMATRRGALGAALLYCVDVESKLTPASENTDQS